MTSTRVIRPSSFKVNTTYKRNTKTVDLPTPAKLRADTGFFQDIGAKLVRPQSRKAKTWITRSKGLKTSAGLQEQLVKEEGLKIQIGDKTLKQLLQVEVPDTRKQEYIKDDGSIGVRMIPVLDNLGNPIMVKKVLSIPGTLKYLTKPLADKLDDIKSVLADQALPNEQKQDTSVLLLTGIMQNTDLTADMLKQIDQVTSKMGALSMVNEIPAGNLIDGRFIDSAFIRQNRAFIKSLAFMQARGLGYTPTHPLIRSLGLGPDLIQPLGVLDNLRVIGDPADLLFDVKTNTFIHKDHIDEYTEQIIGQERPVQPVPIVPAAPQVIPPVPQVLVRRPGAIPIIPFVNLIGNRIVSDDYIQNNLPFLMRFALNQGLFWNRTPGNELRIIMPDIGLDRDVPAAYIGRFKQLYPNIEIAFDAVTGTIISQNDMAEYLKRVEPSDMRVEFNPKDPIVTNILNTLTANQRSLIDFQAFNKASAILQIQRLNILFPVISRQFMPPPQIAAPAAPIVGPPAPIVGQIPILQGPPPLPPQGPLPVGQAVIQEQKFQAPGIIQEPPITIEQIRQRMSELRQPVVQLPVEEFSQQEGKEREVKEREEKKISFIGEPHQLNVSEEEKKSFDSLNQKGFKMDEGIKLHPNQAPVFENALNNIIRGQPTEISRNLSMRVGGPNFNISTLTRAEARLIKRMILLNYISVSVRNIIPASIIANVMDNAALIERGVNPVGIDNLNKLGVTTSMIIDLSPTAARAMTKFLAHQRPTDQETQVLQGEIPIDLTLIGDDRNTEEAFNQIFTIGREQGGRGEKDIYDMSMRGFSYSKHLRMGKNLMDGFGYICPRKSLAKEIYSFG